MREKRLWSKPQLKNRSRFFPTNRFQPTTTSMNGIGKRKGRGKRAEEKNGEILIKWVMRLVSSRNQFQFQRSHSRRREDDRFASVCGPLERETKGICDEARNIIPCKPVLNVCVMTEHWKAKAWRAGFYGVKFQGFSTSLYHVLIFWDQIKPDFRTNNYIYDWVPCWAFVMTRKWEILLV